MADSYDFNDGIPEDPKTPKVNSLVVWFLIILPIGIAVGTGWGLYRHFGQEEKLQQKASLAINKDEIKQILTNYAEVIGSRGYTTDEEIKNLERTTKNLEGELQSNNSSMLTYSDNGEFNAAGRAWRTYWADIKGTKSNKVFCVATTYDGEQNFGNAAKLTLLITTAKSLAGDELDYTLRFIFLPKTKSAIEQEEWIKKVCIAADEKHLGTLLLEVEDIKLESQADVWKITGGDKAWGQEMFKGSRVNTYAFAAMSHGVLVAAPSNVNTINIDRVDKAAKSLRKILFTALGGDR